jgi:hypothetical protein
MNGKVSSRGPMRAAVSFENYDDFSFWQLPPGGDFWLSVADAARRTLYPRRKWRGFAVVHQIEAKRSATGKVREIMHLTSYV